MNEDWLQTIKEELYSKASSLSIQYNYDFYNDEPIQNPPGRFIWFGTKNKNDKILKRSKTGIDNTNYNSLIKRLHSLTTEDN